MIDIKLVGINHSFQGATGDVDVLDSIELEVHRGKLLAIVGPSGCGKSTLLKIIAGLICPTGGSVHVDKGRIDAGIAYVPQSDSLLPWRTARQNACLGLEFSKELRTGEALSKARIGYIDSMFDEWRLAGFENAYPSELSGGMIQRVALIRALVSKPKILLCDEPFSAIDYVSRLRLNVIFKKMCRVEGITTVLVTHNIEDAIFLADQILVLTGRPGRKVSLHVPNFPLSGSDSVSFRTSEEFGRVFNAIVHELEDSWT